MKPNCVRAKSFWEIKPTLLFSANLLAIKWPLRTASNDFQDLQYFIDFFCFSNKKDDFFGKLSTLIHGLILYHTMTTYEKRWPNIVYKRLSALTIVLYKLKRLKLTIQTERLLNRPFCRPSWQICFRGSSFVLCSNNIEIRSLLVFRLRNWLGFLSSFFKCI